LIEWKGANWTLLLILVMGGMEGLRVTKEKGWVNDEIFLFYFGGPIPLMISCITLWTVVWNLWINTAMLTRIHTETSVFIWLVSGWWHSGWFSHFIGHRGRTGLCLFRASQRDTVSLSIQLPHWSLYQCQTQREKNSNIGQDGRKVAHHRGNSSQNDSKIIRWEKVILAHFIFGHWHWNM